MTMMNFYAHEKTAQIEQERLASLPEVAFDVPCREPIIIGPLAAGAGRALRRVGEGLESWGADPPAEHDHPQAQRM
jgi:hypothetical protein